MTLTSTDIVGVWDVDPAVVFEVPVSFSAHSESVSQVLVNYNQHFVYVPE